MSNCKYDCYYFCHFHPIIKCYTFQKDSPSAKQMTALGIYILSSLFFVVAGMVEYAVLLYLLRHSGNVYDHRRTQRLHPSVLKSEKYSIEFKEDRMDSKTLNIVEHSDCKSMSNYMELSDRIDYTATLMFPLTYILFNTVYWLHYLS